MRLIQFIGEYLICLDDAGRMLLSEEVLRQMMMETSAVALQAIQGQNQKIWLYLASDFERMFSEADRSHVAMSWRIKPDRASRVTLPPKLLMRCVIPQDPQDLTLIGVGNHLELWGRTEWREYSRAIRK